MSSVECSLKSLTSPHSGDLLQSHNSLTFKVLKTVADFSQALATLHDRFGHELQMLVETFRKRNGELRKERLNCPNSLFQIWELFLQQVEVNSQQHGDISRDLSQTNGNGLIERVFHRKIQSKKIFAHKERIEAILLKSNELLVKCHKDYCQAYALALTDPAQFLNEYIASHNVYVHQLQATNGMVHAYQTKTLPRLLEELEECQLGTSSSISIALLSSSELIAEKSSEQAAGYEHLAQACRQANHRQDLAAFVKTVASMPAPPPGVSSIGVGAQNQDNSQHNNPSEGSAGSGGSPKAHTAADRLKSIRYHQFQAANWQQSSQLDSLGAIDPKNLQIVPTFKNEIAPDFSQPPDQQQPKLEKDRELLEEKIDKFEERIEALARQLARSHESRLHNKANELQEELCARRFDLYVAQIHLSAVRSQLQLFEYNFRPLVGSVSQLPLAPGVDHSIMAPGGGADHGPSSQLSAGGQLLGGQEGQDGGGGGGLVGASSSGPGAGASALAGLVSGGSRKSPQSSGGRNKWIKAFKSLKDTPGQQQQPGQQKFSDSNSSDFQMDGQQQQQTTTTMSGDRAQQQLENQHFFQEYTFKKIASCDVCKDFLRGHMRQGVKCKLCKISCHNDCQTKAHGTIKCQQPKIKLLRRQKSAGELEVNSDAGEQGGNADQGERGPASSKPDSIYSLIRQVLDAKKRGQHHAPTMTAQFNNQQQDQQEQHHLLRANNLQVGPGSGGGLASSQMMNLSTGNLALANQNGKSVSTSALLQKPRPESSVDRWSVVMDLLAQSRHASKHKSGGEAGAETDGGPTGSGKRHSKQLDKFKLAARSVGKHQRYQQATVMFAEHPPSTSGADDDDAERAGNSIKVNHQPQHQSLAQSMSANVGVIGPEGAGPHTGHPQQQQQQSYPLADHQQQQQQQQLMHVHHTKSLPVGQMPPAACGGGGGTQTVNATMNPQYDPHGMLVGVAQHPQQQQQQLHHPMSHHMQQQQQHMGYDQTGAGGPSSGHHHLVVRPSLSNPSQQPGGSGGVVQPPLDRQYQQLLDISLQQQSTSAPHSPQRKRFNLRMKSFSLDSPDSPVVGVGGTGTPLANAAGAYSNSNLPGHHQYQAGQQHPISYHTQQQQQQHYSPPHHDYEQTRRYGGQQHQPTFYYQPPGVVNPSTQSSATSTAGPVAEAGEHHGNNNYNQQTGSGGGGDTVAQRQQQQQQQQSTADSSYLSSYPSNELLDHQDGVAAAAATTGRHFSSSSNSAADTSYHGGSQSTLLRPGGQQSRAQTGGGGPSQRHQQQHRHSYHNPMSAAAYRFQEGAMGQLMAPGGGGDPFGASTGGGGGDLMPAGRHCASSSALNTVNGGQLTAGIQSSSANKSKKQGQQLGSGGQLHKQQQQQHYNMNGAHPHHSQQPRQDHPNGGRARDSTSQLAADYYDLDIVDQHDQQKQSQQQPGVVIAAAGQQQQPQPVGGATVSSTPAVITGDTFVVLYDYAAQRSDEIQLNAGQLIQVLDTSERDWWKVGALDGTNRIGYFPSSYLAQLFQNERPLQVAQTIQVSNGETCDKLLRGQIVIHTGKQLDNFVTIRTIRANASPNDAPQALVNYIQCPEKYLLEVIESH